MTQGRRPGQPLSERERALLDRVDWAQIQADIDERFTKYPDPTLDPDDEFWADAAGMASSGCLPVVGAPFTDEEKALLAGLTAPNPLGLTQEEFWSLDTYFAPEPGAVDSP
jgi:hypothetical protein